MFTKATASVASATSHNRVTAMSQSYDPAARRPRPALQNALIGLAFSLGALAAMGASSGPARAQWTVSATPSALFSESYSPYTATVSSVANGSYLPGTIQFQNPTSPAGLNPFNMSWNGQTSLYLTIAPGNYPAVLSGSPMAYYVSGSGVQDNIDTTWQASWTYGPNISISNDATLTLTNVPAQIYGNGGYGGPIAASYGANGWLQSGKGPTKVPYGGAVGGATMVTNAGSITVNATETISGTGVPWSPFLQGIYASSVGGNGVGQKTNDNDFGGDGGNGGPVTVTTNPGSQINLLGAGNPTGTINGITAYSQGGLPGCRCSGDSANTWGASGSGGAITIQHGGSIESIANDSIGIVAFNDGVEVFKFDDDATGAIVEGAGEVVAFVDNGIAGSDFGERDEGAFYGDVTGAEGEDAPEGGLAFVGKMVGGQEDMIVDVALDLSKSA